METKETSIKDTNNISVCKHPIALHNLSILRDKNTNSELFRNASKRLAQLLIFVAIDNLPLIKKITETPLMETTTNIIDPQTEIIIAPILRAGLVFSDVASDILPDARIHHIGLYRDERTLKPIPYYNNLPENYNNPEKTFVYLLDPMLATGGTAITAIKLFIDRNIPQYNVRLISLISAPEGIDLVHSKFPDIKIITASVDSKLNKVGYILPGLGDAGDRAFNTTY